MMEGRDVAIDLTCGEDALRIGLVAPPWVPVPPVDYGGTEQVVDTLARGLVRAGHEVVLFTTGDATCDVPRRWHHPHALGTIAPLLAELSHAEAAYRHLADCDVVHDHTLMGPVVAGVEAYAHLPVVTTAHGPFVPDLRAHFRLVAPRATIITISESQRRTVPDLPAVVVHHGIDVDAVPFGDGGGGYALFVGRMSPDKGVHVAIDAARTAGVPLVIAAKMWEPDEIDYFEQQIRPRLGPGVEYVGTATAPEKHRLMAGASALLNPICWPEPFGLVMVEALAAGTPVVAFPRGAAPEIVDHGVTGFLSRDADELVAHLLAAPGLDRAACRAAVERRFSAARMVTDHVRTYRHRILHHRSGVPRRPARTVER